MPNFPTFTHHKFAGMKVLVVGLPLFAKRVASALSAFDPDNTYKSLDTYYKKADKVRALLSVPAADCLYSINGSLTDSRVFDLALKKKTPIIMHWVGTDVLKATEAFKSGNYRKDYIENATHFCEVGWIQEELKEIGIHAEIVNFVSFDKTYDPLEGQASRLSILNYIPQKRTDFYGLPNLLNAAKQCPDTDFIVAGSSLEDVSDLPPNVKALGWVKDMDVVFNKVHAAMRFTKHDGLSSFVLESLARGKAVIYNNHFDHCTFASNDDELISRIHEMENKFNQDASLINKQGMDFISKNYNKEYILNNLRSKLISTIKPA